jgi:hypothetical protein
LTFDIVNFTFFLLSQPSQCFGGNWLHLFILL